MKLFADCHPALILIFGALLVPLFRGHWRNALTIALPVLAFLCVAALPEATDGLPGWKADPLPWSAEPLSFLRVDKLAKAFGYIFCLNAVAAFVFAFYVKKSTQHVAALVYIGSGLGAVFAGDLLTLYAFWEMMAVSSTFVILARGTDAAKGAAFRYVMIHILGGLFLLAGIVLHAGPWSRFWSSRARRSRPATSCSRSTACSFSRTSVTGSSPTRPRPTTSTPRRAPSPTRR